MRLGQLARKLEIRPAEIVEFLALKGIVIEENANSRVEDDHVTAIQKHFNPASLNEVVNEAADKKEPEALKPIVVLETALPEIEDEVRDSHEVEDPGEKPDVELIKAPKVELSGLKILGKIDLPEAKKKAEQAELPLEVPQAQASATRPQQRGYRNESKERPEQRARKNPIALQREREALEEQKKRAEKAELEKERKTRNYHKRVKMSPPTKAVRMVDEPVMQMSAEELEEAPKTWFGRLIKWLTTA
jgi:hypothetical protein